MSRFRKFAHSLISGYVSLSASIAYTLASVPLALRYLSKAEFGLWGVTLLVAGYVALIDLGMSASMARLLIDHKDDQARGLYGGLIKTGFLVGVAQGVLMFLIGTVLALAAGTVLKVPAELQRDFSLMLCGQCALLGLSFAFRIFNHLLTAHQRYDISNYGQSVLFLVGFFVLWLLLARGAGVFSALWAQAFWTVGGIVVNGLGCWRLKLFPARYQWGVVSWVQFAEVFVFGRDIFLFALGSQLISTSQTLLLTRFFGLETAAVWTVCTRAYSILLQVIYRIFDYSSSALAEMIVRGEMPLLRERFRQIVVVSTSLSVLTGTIFAICNNTFVEIWTAKKISWAPRNDILLAVWLLISVSVHAHVGLVGQTKCFRFLRYIFFLEGLVFVGATILLHRFGGISGMVAASIVCSLVFSFPYGLRRTVAYFKLSWAELLEWHRAPLQVGLWLLPLAALVAWITAEWPLLARLVARAGLVAIPGVWIFLRYGLGTPLQTEVARRVPGWVRSFLMRICAFPPGQ